jgi:replicative DNA helicase
LEKKNKAYIIGHRTHMQNTQNPSGRVPPQNLDGEMSLLGSILIRPEVLHDIITFFKPHNFYAEKHRIIYAAIMSLFEKQDPVDLLTLTSKLRELKQLDIVGGINYLSDIASSVGTSSNADYFAKDIYKKSVLRDLIKVSHTIGEIAYDEAKDLDQTLEDAEKQIYDISQKNSGTAPQFVEIKDTLEEAWKRIEKMHERKGELRGVDTGFKDLNNLLSGFQKSDLIILAARPSVGKTSLALNFIRHAAVNNGTAVAFFSLEMSKEQLVDRLVSAQSRVDSWKLRTGSKLQDSDWESLQASLNQLSAAPIFIDDEAAISPIKIRSKLRRMNMRKPIELVVVDYLQLMSANRQYDNMVNQVTEISRALKGIAKEFNVPVIALSQLSRAVEARGGKPKLSDLRDSGSIEQDADVVMFIHREDRSKSVSDRTDGPIEAEILIEKHRNGPTGYVKLHFDDKKTTFVSVDRQFADFDSLPNVVSKVTVQGDTQSIGGFEEF